MTDDPTPTPRFRQIIAAARRTAQARGHPHLGVEHLMLAILDDGASVAAQAIAATGASSTDIRARIELIMNSEGYRGPLRPPGTATSTADSRVGLHRDHGEGE